MTEKIFIFAIEIYQKYISPFGGQHCRFYPSCSAYAKTALGKKGFVKGCRFALQRVLKCHPFHPGGIDYLE
jgi:putative membrane protein insertion efficiency factor